MSENSKIEWCDHTINPWIGCTRVGPGCDNCYAATQDAFRKWTPEGWGGPRRRTSASNWALPIRWNAQAEAFSAKHGRRQRVFCASLADVFDNQVPVQWRVELMALILATPNLDWLLLTKRIGNVRGMLAECLALAQDQMSRMQSEQDLAAWLADWVDGNPPPNVWIGATVVNQEEADRDVPKLLGTPAAVRFISMEPLLGPVDLRNVAVPAEHDRLRRPWDYEGYKFNALTEHDDDRFHQAPATLDWVIVGGESGSGARPMHPDWVKTIRDQCAAAGVPFLFKQWGEWAITSQEAIHPEAVRLPGNLCRVQGIGKPDHFVAVSIDGGRIRYRLDKIGKKAAGRLLDGVRHDGFPGGAA